MDPKPKTKLPSTCMPRDVMLQAAMIRLGDITKEIQAGYNILRKYHKTVTIFGSARMPKDHPAYTQAKDIAEKLAHAGYAIVSGGGYGIMGAANEGAHNAVFKGANKAGGASIGFNIKLPHEQTLNDFAGETYEFAHFAPRKIVMTLYADAYIYFPGGFGTLDELTEIITLVQTGKTAKAPIILVGSDFWSHFDKLIREQLLTNGFITEEDVKLYQIVDDTDEIIRIVKSNQTYCRHLEPTVPGVEEADAAQIEPEVSD